MNHRKIGRRKTSWLAAKIDIVLRGEKLRGGFTLVRIEKRSSNSGDQWLLIKHRDEHADPSWDIESPRFDRCVLTGRSLKEIKDGKPLRYKSGQRSA
jgi:bifunctional non-homologous end joining protein LigD